MSDVDDTNPQLDLSRLKHNKAQIKGELTRFQNFLDKTDLSTSIELVQIRVETIKPLLDKFRSVQTHFEELILGDFPDNYNEDDYTNERDEFETRYFKALAQGHKILDKHFSSLSPALNSATPNNQTTHGAMLPNVAAKLPLLTLPEFSGSYSEWQRFRDMFCALVHNNGTLSDVQRFYYLEASLKGEPKNLIASLIPTDANYSTAWELLKKRYENKKVMINSHLKEIMDLPILVKESHSSLRSFANTFLKNYRSLESLGENVSEWNTILIYILVSKLDTNTKREWEICCKGMSCPKIDDFNEFITQRCQLLEALDTKASTNFKKPFESKSFITSTTYRPKCPNCKEQHFIYFCDKFKELSISERLEKVKKLNLCINCLRYGHRSSECRSSGCKICRQRHATLLHKSQEITCANNQNSNTDNKVTEPQSLSQTYVTEIKDNPKNDEGDILPQGSSVMSNTCTNTISSFILLSTAIVNVYDKHKNIVPCRVLLDSASQSNFISSSMFKKLHVPSTKINLPVVGINQIKTNISQRAEISLSSQHSGYKTKLNFLVIPKITEVSPQRYFDTSSLNIPDDLPLADPDFNTPAEIDMLLGGEVFFELLCIGQIKLGKNLPILQKTLLGWIVSGQVPCGQGKLGKSEVMLSNCFFIENSLNDNLEKFWSIEEINPNPRSLMTKEEIDCEMHFQENTRRDETGRFIVKFPLKTNFLNLGDSEQSALNRLYSMEKRLAKNPEIERSYVSFMKEYQTLGHMTEIPRDSSSKTPIYYIPHHYVEKLDSSTTKLRVVFDAACKSSTNLSLNNVLKVGPTIQNDLFSILLRFRKHNFVFIGDLTKMYRQVLIDESERNLQRIVWRNSPKDEVKHFQLNTVTYGTASASFLSTRCLLQISRDIADNYSLESDIIASDFYVDDLLTGSSNLDTLKKLRQNISTILSEYGFELRKFQSNNREIVHDINKHGNVDDKYSITDDSSIKTLGVSWIPNLDKFEYNSQNLLIENDRATKRNILSFISKIFDPLGILGPLTIRAKLIIQKLWQLRLDWDESLPNELYTEWLEVRNELSQVGSLHIPRHVLVKEPNVIEIHGFSDASEKAYACCIYLRSISVDNKIESHLLCAKSRVSPLKSISLPRLELSGSLLLAKLMAKCKDALKLKIQQTFLWTDSTIVLSWISAEPKRWKTFVANRVAEIQQLTNIEDWNYISSDKNPADIISRGSSIKNLITSSLWLHGPDFFIEFKKWPENTNIVNFKRSTQNIPEAKTVPKITLSTQVFNYEIFEIFSSFSKMVRVTAYCLRFFNNLKLPVEKRNTGRLSSLEIHKCELVLVKLVQSQSFSIDIHDLKNKGEVSSKSKLRSLCPFIDHDGIVRIGGRLSNSNYAYDIKHPIVLPSDHDFTKLVIDHEHKRTLHSGVQGTLSHIRQKYWPLNGKNAVKSYIRRCIPCFKTNPNIDFPKMGDLPKSRVNPSRPFASVAVDYAGPFELKDGKTRSNKIIKGYVCIFVCLATKAVHIEVITDLTSDGFLSLLKRFVSRRGFCSYVYSDNGTNFVGCNNNLISVKKLIESSSVQTYVVHSNINWHFMPSRSPHFGGLHEAAVKSCKHHLKRVLNGTRLCYEEFYTLTTQIEAILNSRPLVPMSTDPNDLCAITPAHFLIGQELTALPERDLSQEKVNYRRRYQHLQLMGQHFWTRWRKEYLHHLQQRSKWQLNTNQNYRIGSLVLLKEDNVPSMFWPAGRIVEVHPGKDNVVRVVSVKTKNGVVKRSVTKISLFPEE